MLCKWISELFGGGASRALPPYVNHGGEQVYAQPVSLRDVTFSSFLLRADIAALRKTCDQTLNLPGNRIRYHPVAPMVMLGVADCGKIGSVNPPDSEKGYIEEIDVAFWTLVAGVKKVGGINVVDHLAWFLPYVFVNNAWACACGREIFGFAKEMGDIQIPTSIADTADYTVDTLVLPTFSPQTKAETKRLLTLHRTSLENDVQQEWTGIEDTMEAMLRAFTEGETKVTLPGLDLIIELWEFLVHKQVPLVFLKQFRDVADGTRACYQSIVRAPARVVAFRKAGLLPGRYSLSVNDYASHPIIKDLGLSGSTSQVRFAAYIDFDFDMENGTYVS